MKALRKALQENEEWLMERVRDYALDQGYTRYTSSLASAWRLSISGLSQALTQAMDQDSQSLGFGPDETFSADPAAVFAIREAKLHRERGVTLAMFLGLLKYYRQSYSDMVAEKVSRTGRKKAGEVVARFFDRVEIGIVLEWASRERDALLGELQEANRNLTNEKNKYLTVFESFASPAFLFDLAGKLQQTNRAAGQWLEQEPPPGKRNGPEPSLGDSRIGDSAADILPELAEDIAEFAGDPAETRKVERGIRRGKEARYFLVSLGKLLDFSNRFVGVVVALEDITTRRIVEQTLLHKKELLSETVRKRMKQLEAANRKLEKEVARRTALEDALRKGARFYRAVVEDQTELVCRFAPDYTLTFVNNAYGRFFGRSEDQLLGSSLLALLPAGYREEFLDHLRAITPDSPLRVVEHAATAADGSVRWQRWTERGFFDAAGNAVEYQSVGSDITDRHRAEEELRRLNAELERRVEERTRAAEEKAVRLEREVGYREEVEEKLRHAYREAATQNRIAEVFLTVPGEEMFSQVLQVLLEATGSELGYFGYLDEAGALVVPSLNRDVWEQCRVPDKTLRFPRESWGDAIWARSIREKRLLVQNGPGRVPEGHVPLSCVLAAPILFRGEVIGHVALANRSGGYGWEEEEIVEDACRRIAPVLRSRLQQERTEAERGRVEVDLRESRMMLRQILDAVPQSIFWKDADSVYLGCNQVFARACGLAGPELIVGKTDYDLPWPRAEADAYRADDAEVVASKRSKLHILEPLQQKDGSRLWIDTSKIPLLDSRQEVRGVLGVYEDVTEKKLAEEALRTSEAKYRSLFESMGEGACILDVVRDQAGAIVDFRIADVNPAYSAILDIPRERAVGALVKDLYGLSRPPDLEEYSRVLADGSPASFETFLPELGLHFHVSASRLGPDRLVSMFQDISNRRRAEDALRRRLETEQVLAGVSGQLVGLRFEEIGKNLPELLSIVAETIGADAGWVCAIELGGHACLASWSSTGEAPLDGLCPGPGGEAHAWVLSQLGALETIVVRRIEELPDEAATLRARFAQRGIASLLAAPLARGEALVGALVFAALRAPCDWSGEDVSLIETLAVNMANSIESARLERTLRYNERRYFDLIDGLSEGLLSLDRDMKVVFLNRSMARILGYESAQILGSDPRTYMTEESAREFSRKFRERLQGKTEKYSFEFVHREGRRVTVSVSAAPVRDEQGGIVGSMALVSDLSKERLLQLQLIQAQRLEAIGQLAAGIAHEINTPAQYVDNNTQFLRGAFDDLLAVLREHEALLGEARAHPALAAAVGRVEGAREERQVESLLADIPGAFDDASDGLQRISLIVDSVKRFAHPGRDAIQLADLNAALRSTIVVARNEWKYVAEVATELDPDLPLVPCVLSDINQVVLNLIVNAAHAIAEVADRPRDAKGLITIRTRAEEGWAVIEVADTGTGIPAAIRSRVFDPFFTTKEVGRGTGQGLAIGHTVVSEKHRGSITFDTEEGKGTTFFVRLPLTQPRENAAQ